MKVELFLESIHQEYADPNKRKKLNGAQWHYKWGGDWAGDWVYRSGVLNCNFNRKELKGINRVLTFKLRKENFGGLIYDPVSSAVFRADKEAFEAIQLLKQNISPPKKKRLIELLRKYNLW